MPPNRTTRPPRALPAGALLGSALLLAGAVGCAPATDVAAEAAELAETEIPDEVPPGTKLTVGAPRTEVALKLSGLVDELPFEVEWANLSGGPECSEAFRAGALDACAAAEIPAIHAHWTGLDTKLVAASFRADPIANPVYELGVAPGAEVRSLSDLRGKRIAFSPGQAQGALMLRVLAEAGLTPDDVELVELPSTGDVYPTALGNGEVDVAPLAETNIRRFAEQYGPDGGSLLAHGLRDDPAHLWVPTSAVSDPGTAAAVRELVALWARAEVWIDEHPEEWIEGYYMEDQGLSREDGEYLVELAGEPDLPADWTDAIERQRETVRLLAEELDREPFDAELLFDRRYETVAAEAIAEADGAEADRAGGAPAAADGGPGRGGAGGAS